MRPAIGAILGVGLCLAAGPWACAQREVPVEVQEQAVAGCLAGLAAVSAQPPEERSTFLAAACQGVFREPGCRQAWARLGQVSPEARATSLVEACRQAYCPLLSEPRPGLCTAQAVPDAVEARAEVWRELLSAILQRDLGAQRAARLQVGMALLSSAYEVYSVRLPEARVQLPEGPRLLVRVGPERILVSVVRDEAVVRNLELPARPGAADLARAREAVRAAGGEPGQAVLSVAPELPYARVVELMDSLREAGFTDLVLSTDEAGPGGAE
ncbi:MAG TPA: hypothetical protein PK668_27880 [Myxococcota bacterium]|nr:hypothetical protein [Myxococcota bacterium]HRY97329.1 hypothetical protein [Myxococcota bacterium]HSA24476.1 hypothetical protein [Myxococcota bacterium]